MLNISVSGLLAIILGKHKTWTLDWTVDYWLCMDSIMDSIIGLKFWSTGVKGHVYIAQLQSFDQKLLPKSMHCYYTDWNIKISI